jgi:hypothetical protein
MTGQFAFYLFTAVLFVPPLASAAWHTWKLENRRAELHRLADLHHGEDA